MKPTLKYEVIYSCKEKYPISVMCRHTAQGVLYLSMIRDLYDNSIVAHKCGTEQTVNFVLNTIKLVFEKEAVVADSAAWHKSNGLVVPENIEIFPLLPYTPELNHRNDLG